MGMGMVIPLVIEGFFVRWSKFEPEHGNSFFWLTPWVNVSEVAQFRIKTVFWQILC
jgi:hypothetical protein